MLTKLSWADRSWNGRKCMRTLRSMHRCIRHSHTLIHTSHTFNPIIKTAFCIFFEMLNFFTIMIKKETCFDFHFEMRRNASVPPALSLSLRLCKNATKCMAKQTNQLAIHSASQFHAAKEPKQSLVIGQANRQSDWQVKYYVCTAYTFS